MQRYNSSIFKVTKKFKKKGRKPLKNRNDPIITAKTFFKPSSAHKKFNSKTSEKNNKIKQRNW